ncbi:MAG: Uma2 family endonuclease, partial [Pseudonocardia sp.]|nr:Uma2 family endonuclease [Pseudonocardia sp.]
PDEPRYRHAELVDGELVLVSPPTWLHQHVMTRLVAAFVMWCAAAPGRGEITVDPPVRITNLRAYLPDVAWYRDGRGRPAAGRPYLAGPPDLAIEVLSPSTRTVDMIRKRTDYARVGVRELWLIDPEEPAAFVLRAPDPAMEPAEFVLVEELAADGELTSPMLPGLAVRLGDVVPEREA